MDRFLHSLSMAKSINVVILLILFSMATLVIEARNTCIGSIRTPCIRRQDCDPQCHQMYTGSEGVCLGFVYGVTNGLCSCSYPCGPPDPPPSCLGGSGINCSLQCGNDCCSQRCAGKFRNGSGHCRSINGMSICECYYPC
ncbi:hypothetical protein QQ045_003659 [Rhodiola kirilowii]